MENKPLTTETTEACLPKNYRIHQTATNKFVLEKRCIFFWIPVLKACLNVRTRNDCTGTYYDSRKRAYRIEKSNGKCRTFSEAVEFYRYKPKQIFRINAEISMIVLWANNNIARNLIHAEHVYLEHSRKGLFLPHNTDAQFISISEPYGKFIIQNTCYAEKSA